MMATKTKHHRTHKIKTYHRLLHCADVQQTCGLVAEAAVTVCFVVESWGTWYVAVSMLASHATQYEQIWRERRLVLRIWLPNYLHGRGMGAGSDMQHSGPVEQMPASSGGALVQLLKHIFWLGLVQKAVSLRPWGVLCNANSQWVGMTLLRSALLVQIKMLIKIYMHTNAHSDGADDFSQKDKSPSRKLLEVVHVE